MKRSKEQQLIAFALIFFILTIFPFLSIFNQAVLVFHRLPLLYVYIFSIWILFILTIRIFVYSGKRDILKEKNEMDD